MPGLVPGIHVLLGRRAKDVDAREKPGHDADGSVAVLRRRQAELAFIKSITFSTQATRAPCARNRGGWIAVAI